MFSCYYYHIYIFLSRCVLQRWTSPKMTSLATIPSSTPRLACFANKKPLSGLASRSAQRRLGLVPSSLSPTLRLSSEYQNENSKKQKANCKKLRNQEPCIMCRSIPQALLQLKIQSHKKPAIQVELANYIVDRFSLCFLY